MRRGGDLEFLVCYFSGALRGGLQMRPGDSKIRSYDSLHSDEENRWQAH